MTLGEFGSSFLYEFGILPIIDIESKGFVSDKDFNSALLSDEQDRVQASEETAACSMLRGLWAVGCNELVELVAQGAKVRWVSVEHGMSLGAVRV